jgi:hypothetical protein
MENGRTARENLFRFLACFFVGALDDLIEHDGRALLALAHELAAFFPLLERAPCAAVIAAIHRHSPKGQHIYAAIGVAAGDVPQADGLLVPRHLKRPCPLLDGGNNRFGNALVNGLLGVAHRLALSFSNRCRRPCAHGLLPPGEGGIGDGPSQNDVSGAGRSRRKACRRESAMRIFAGLAALGDQHGHVVLAWEEGERAAPCPFPR